MSNSPSLPRAKDNPPSDLPRGRAAAISQPAAAHSFTSVGALALAAIAHIKPPVGVVKS